MIELIEAEFTVEKKDGVSHSFKKHILKDDAEWVCKNYVEVNEANSCIAGYKGEIIARFPKL